MMQLANKGKLGALVPFCWKTWGTGTISLYSKGWCRDLVDLVRNCWNFLNSLSDLTGILFSCIAWIDIHIYKR